MPTPGSIVRCREREWVLLPGAEDDRFWLRPLIGRSDDVIAISRTLSEIAGYTLPEERVHDAHFPLPTPSNIQDATAAMLFWRAARMALRDGATPLRSLGRISIRPRLYQFVPLLMALRLQPVRLLIADDVGVGKTIEALLIARELWDRGEIRSLAVLCPPYLCDQWQQELRQKFHLDAVVVRPGTISDLDRQAPQGVDFYHHFPVQVISIDWVKTSRHRDRFLVHCPDFVIVDEAHGVAPATDTAQQLRHELVRELAAKAERHLVLLTATPHSGNPDTFRALIGLLDPEFATWDVSNLSDGQRARLARHFVQRTRTDIEQSWPDGVRCFPQRDLRDAHYYLTPAYESLFRDVYTFCAELVKRGDGLREPQRRVRYWAALSILRCVMSSPAAARVALRNRAARLTMDDDALADDTIWQGAVFESGETETDDETPTTVIEQAELSFNESEQRRLDAFIRRAEQIAQSNEDAKLTGAIGLVRQLIDEGYAPIVWCRYVATADYVARAFRQHLSGVHVTLVTGRMGEEERRAVIAAAPVDQPRVLVATDCISEGINLHERYNAAIHYDLPWNPNRLEQREGRVDRYGQTAPTVVTVRYYGLNNEVDTVVIDVLLRKAREIRRALGAHVPVPAESVMDALTKTLFLRREQPANQLRLDLVASETVAFHQRWDEAVAREKKTRTRFAQHALKLDDVRPVIEATDRVLGDPDEVRDFVVAAAGRVGLRMQPQRGHPDVFHVTTLPETPPPIADAIPEGNGAWAITFSSPAPGGVEYIGRNHRLVSRLASYLFSLALTRSHPDPNKVPVARIGVIRTDSVNRLTVIWLTRARYLLHFPGSRHPLLAEEALVSGYVDEGGTHRWLDEATVTRLLREARSAGNISPAEKRELAEMVLAELGEANRDHPIWQALATQTEQRAAELKEMYRRVRQALQYHVRGIAVEPVFPPDLLGMIVLQPIPRRGTP
ncbi:MAG: helicase [Chloroflexus sp.]|uniref:helicase-related protein n=1 Tax=Chloroflexus sp. TaxID=1904827 RepID=UPI0021DE2917|nr:helicase-related protein [Chloroflexus sp.]GIV88245.1 MAG: helicase [Chloroflexus sp.]